MRREKRRGKDGIVAAPVEISLHYSWVLEIITQWFQQDIAVSIGYDS